jgi:hypothetical protein
MTMNATLGQLILFAASASALTGCARSHADATRVNVNNVAALRTTLGGDKAGAAAEAGPVAEPTGFATIKGTFKINGAAPAPIPLIVDKEQSVCAPGGKKVFSEEVIVDQATGGIKDVVLYLSDKKYLPGDPKWEHPDYAAAANATLDFDQKACVFLTHVFAMRTTQKCKVLNSDPVGHNTNLAGGGRAKAENFIVASGSNALYEPGGESPEPFAVACNIHPWMSARMLVRNNPYYAVTSPTGEFEIKNVPAGVPLEFRVWQEKAKFIQTVTTSGQIDKYAKGRLTVTLQPGEQRQLDFVVDAKLLGGTSDSCQVKGDRAYVADDALILMGAVAWHGRAAHRMRSFCVIRSLRQDREDSQIEFTSDQLQNVDEVMQAL